MLPLNVILPLAPGKFESTFKNSKLPSLYILACVCVVSIPVKKLALTKLPPIILPDTRKLVNVPTVVMFGCNGLTTFPAYTA